jgi:hypothetical protein
MRKNSLQANKGLSLLKHNQSLIFVTKEQRKLVINYLLSITTVNQ